MASVTGTPIYKSEEEEKYWNRELRRSDASQTGESAYWQAKEAAKQEAEKNAIYQTAWNEIPPSKKFRGILKTESLDSMINAQVKRDYLKYQKEQQRKEALSQALALLKSLPQPIQQTETEEETMVIIIDQKNETTTQRSTVKRSRTTIYSSHQQ